MQYFSISSYLSGTFPHFIFSTLLYLISVIQAASCLHLPHYFFLHLKGTPYALLIFYGLYFYFILLNSISHLCIFPFTLLLSCLFHCLLSEDFNATHTACIYFTDNRNLLICLLDLAFPLLLSSHFIRACFST